MRNQRSRKLISRGNIKNGAKNIVLAKNGHANQENHKLHQKANRNWIECDDNRTELKVLQLLLELGIWIFNRI